MLKCLLFNGEEVVTAGVAKEQIKLLTWEQVTTERAKLAECSYTKARIPPLNVPSKQATNEELNAINTSKVEEEKQPDFSNQLPMNEARWRRSLRR
jgi:hypothetical protein